MFETVHCYKHPKYNVTSTDEGTMSCHWCADLGELERVKAERARLVNALSRVVGPQGIKTRHWRSDQFDDCVDALRQASDDGGVTDFHRVCVLKAACEKAMGEMRDCDSVETDNGMKYWGFDDEIAACEAALKRCNE